MLRHPQLIRKHFGPGNFRSISGTSSGHAARAFFVLRTRRAAIMTWDGPARHNNSVFTGAGHAHQSLKRIKLPHSLGTILFRCEKLHRFDLFAGDEGKLMGLAAYGKPDYYDLLRRQVLTEWQARLSSQHPSAGSFPSQSTTSLVKKSAGSWYPPAVPMRS